MSQIETQDMQLMEEAIAYYHALLANSRMLAGDSVKMLEEQMPPRKLTFGGKPLCNVLRPHFFTRGQFDYVSEVCTALTSAMARLGEVIMLGEDKAEAERMLNELGLTDEERRLLAYDTGYKAISAHSRLDSFLSLDGSLQFVEYNAESPAGASYEDGLADLFTELPIMREFTQRFKVSRFNVKEKMLAMLLKTYREYAGDANKIPNIAIVDWDDVPTQTEFELLQEYFQGKGVPTVICTPQQVEYRNGQLYFEDFAIDLLFKRVLASELLQRADEVRPILQAYEDGAVCMINSFRCKLFHKKMIFGLLTDERNAHYFTPEQQDYITRHIPWTRPVRPGQTIYQSKSINLEEFVREHRENLVLKPNDEYGGKGIYIGWESDEQQWQEAYRVALDSPYVVQEKVIIAKEPFPVIQNDMLMFAERSVDCDPYIFDGEVVGVLTRLSAAALLNVTAGTGSVVPTFVIEGRGEGGIRPADSEGCV